MRWARIPRFLLCTLGLQEEKGHPAQCPATAGLTHNAAFKYDSRGDGDFSGRGRSDQPGGLRNLRPTGISAYTASRSGGGDGQPLKAHKGERVKELIEERGCELIYLPPYSPDFNPIEEAFAKIKALVRKAQARTREALVEAIGRGISMVTAEDAQGFFDHCGYTIPV
jgi:DDE superfamily endonuclease